MKPEPVSPASEPVDPRAWVSALVDGETDALDRACGVWRESAEARSAWHAYHLIGDVMRSEDLAADPARDARFLVGLRERLASEPVVLAPVRRRHVWMVPAAVAAGFVAVAGVLVVARMGGGSAPVAAELAAASSAVPAHMVAAGVMTGQQAGQRIDDDGLIRDARLDEFLRAHQFASGGAAIAVPSGALRRVEIVVVPAAPAR
ncbi:MAG: sigma-E factor negative regulatory protein [Burkholderiales bacterium]|nr:sigma-E factor negative regulatory protein [Burkholderiales bacterium]